MYDENGGRAAELRAHLQRIYALLYKLEQDVRRLESLARALKKQTEEQNNV